ncbi:hypothetical protein L6164_020790 [Bauhinia variegata]|nr:hypothetical protein L6164_020790 [Bauhinia variegata]
MFSSPLETCSSAAKSSVEYSSMLLNMPSSVLGDFGKVSEGMNFGGFQENGHNGNYPMALLREMQGTLGNVDDNAMVKIPNMNVARGVEQELETVRSIGFPFSLPLNINGEAWKSNLLWDDVPSNYSTTKCYT